MTSNKRPPKNGWRAGIGVAFLHAVYTSVQTLEIVEKVSLFLTFRPARRDFPRDGSVNNRRSRSFSTGRSTTDAGIPRRQLALLTLEC